MCVQRDPDDEQLACQYSRRVKDVRVMYAVAPDARSGKNVPVARHRHAGRPRLPVGNVLQARSPAGPSNSDFSSPMRNGKSRSLRCFATRATNQKRLDVAGHR